jgi:5-methylcytosine-specific restriction endonuclease McrA
VQTLSDNELLRRLSEAVRQSRRVEADLVTLIAEVDARKLYARRSCSSMFAYCTEVLHLSEHEAYLRIAVARASRRHPSLLAMLRDGRLHLAAIAKLAPHLTDDNCSRVLERAVHKTKLQVEELVAELIPRPDTPPVVRKLPARFGTSTRLAPPPHSLPPAQPHQHAQPQPLAHPQPSAGPQTSEGPRPQLGPDRVEGFALNPASAGAAGAASAPAPPTSSPSVPAPGWPVRPPSHRPSVEPLAPARYRVQFTASAELREKLVRLQNLMRTQVPDGDLETLIDDAVSEKLERLEARRFGKTETPRKTVADADPAPKSRHVPAPIRRAVHERDGGRCTYEDASGRRCTARDRLEFHHHRRAFARGGEHSVDNLRLMCRTHNQLLAERQYGKTRSAQHGQRGSQDGRRPQAEGKQTGRGPAGKDQPGRNQAAQAPTGRGQAERTDRERGLTGTSGPP